jgi:hypothetical protein
MRQIYSILNHKQPFIDAPQHDADLLIKTRNNMDNLRAIGFYFPNSAASPKTTNAEAKASTRGGTSSPESIRVVALYLRTLHNT